MSKRTSCNCYFCKWIKKRIKQIDKRSKASLMPKLETKRGKKT